MSRQAGLVSPSQLRSALGLFATGVTVIAVYDPETRLPRGMTANAFMSVSLDPPLVLVSVRRAAHLHDQVERAGAYGVSVLGADLEREGRRFAGIPLASHEPAPAFVDHAGVPVLLGSLAWVAARVVDTHEGGDHTIFVGEVLDAAAERPNEPPLVFHGATFGRFDRTPLAEPLPLGPWEGPIDAWG